MVYLSRKTRKIIVAGAAIIFSVYAICMAVRDTTEDPTRDPGFRINDYTVYLDVKEDNKIDVTEKINVYFTTYGKHGIYRFIPHWLEYTSKDGKTASRKANIDNLSAIGEQYQLDEVNKKERIKIGDPYVTLPIGFKEYTIKYTYDMGKDPYKGFDEFIFHAYGDYWGTEIHNPKIVIKMPKEIDTTKIKLFTDKYRNTDVSTRAQYNIVDGTIYIDYRGTLSSSLTLDIELPDGYFVGGTNIYGTESLTITILTLIMTVIIYLMWRFYGKDYAKKSQMVEFYPPENMNAAEIGYIYGEYTDGNKLPAALIVQLAAKEYIKIDDLDKMEIPSSSKPEKVAENASDDEEEEEIETGIRVTNLIPKPILSTDSATEMINGRVIKIKRLKSADKDLNLSETIAFNRYFGSKTTVTLTSGIKEFLEIRDKLVDNGYIEILIDNNDKLISHVNNIKSEKDYNEALSKYNEKISRLEPLSEEEKYLYDTLFEDGQDEVILNKHETLYHAYRHVNNELKKKYSKKLFELSSIICTILAIVMNIIILLLSIHSYRNVEDLDPRFRILYFIPFSCVCINYIFIVFMDRMSKRYSDLTVRINGFRDFLDTVEKPKLEELVEENPKYFYNILPYTYVLNISKKWIDKFKDIKIPQIDMGCFDYSDSSSFSSLSSSFYNSSGSGSSGGSGCSSCGGGCSSCGGGCSSCGGGGSW